MLYFFGDSWSSEYCEVERLVKDNKYIPTTPVKSIPGIVSSLTSLPYKNFSVTGSSQIDMLYQLQNSGVNHNDIAIFFLTAPSRRFYLDDLGNTKNLQIDSNKFAINDFNDTWLSSVACFSLYKYCVDRNATPYFINSFNVSWYADIQMHLWKEIPDNRWIISKNKCIVSEWFDPAFYGENYEYRNDDFYRWLSSKNMNVQKYIYPCKEHPNMEGRSLIATKIAEHIS